MPERRCGASKYTNTGPARAKCAATGTPAKPRFDELDLAGSDAAPCQALPPRHRHRKLHLPPNVPVNDFWAVTLYDTQTRSQLQTSQKFRPSEARPRGSRRTRTGRMTSISLRNPRKAKRATGSRQFRVRAGSRSCVCTGRWSHGSTKPGGPARLG